MAHNGFDTADAGRPVGDLLKWNKTQYLRAGHPVPMGDIFVVLLPTMQVGSVSWVDGQIDYLAAGFVEEAGIPPVEEGRSPYTSVMLLDDSNTILTFCSSSWGGRNACKALIPQFRLQKQTMFPVVALGSQPRNNQYGTIDPLFVVKDWMPREQFVAILGPGIIEAPKIAALPPAEPPVRRPAAEIIDDDLPF